MAQIIWIKQNPKRYIEEPYGASRLGNYLLTYIISQVYVFCQMDKSKPRLETGFLEVQLRTLYLNHKLYLILSQENENDRYYKFDIIFI